MVTDKDEIKELEEQIAKINSLRQVRDKEAEERKESAKERVGALDSDAKKEKLQQEQQKIAALKAENQTLIAKTKAELEEEEKLLKSETGEEDKKLSEAEEKYSQQGTREDSPLLTKTAIPEREIRVVHYRSFFQKVGDFFQNITKNIGDSLKNLFSSKRNTETVSGAGNKELEALSEKNPLVYEVNKGKAIIPLGASNNARNGRGRS
jgi:chromosome segregation ATPase